MELISTIKDWFFSFKKEKNIIIDPIACLVKLSILSLYPKGTKISISNNGLSFNNSNIFQGSIRFIQGDCREDLHNIFKPLQKSIEWYWNNANYDTQLKELFDMSELGLINLKDCYEPNSTIQHSLDHYISYIHNRNDNQKYIIKNHNKDNKDNNLNCNDTETTPIIDEKNIIYNFLKTLWSKREIHIIISLFNEYKEENKTHIEKQNIIDTINNLTTTKEHLLLLFIKDKCSTL